MRTPRGERIPSPSLTASWGDLETYSAGAMVQWIPIRKVANQQRLSSDASRRLTGGRRTWPGLSR
ncbi:hypothetical protein E2C01_085381 [Portunus trituberculatus]|uniref:Uncharacterized protein n=1 Tax=Portunus trituberculatus TaxID=210409 RepID=A0A5B7J8Q2_PORTR|nr:hypothetical protein [Portunus trituberculatus]